jgi:hypothetical protein
MDVKSFTTLGLGRVDNYFMHPSQNEIKQAWMSFHKNFRKILFILGWRVTAEYIMLFLVVTLGWKGLQTADHLAYWPNWYVKENAVFVNMTSEAVFLVVCDPSMNEL